MKIQGLDQLTKQLQEIERFTSDIDGTLGEVKFDPFDAESIEHAIVAMENMIDQKAQNYASNSMITDLVHNMKVGYRQQIIDKAAEARLENNEEDKESGE